MPPALPEEIVILVGPPRSGKTTATQFLRNLGYKVISAGEVVGRLDNGGSSAKDRRDLSRRGAQMLRDQGPEWFAERLIAEAAGHSKVVFDGIRPLKTIRHIARLQPKTKILFVKAREDLRRARYSDSPDAQAISYDEILHSDVERSAEGVQADSQIVSNEGTVEEFYHSLKKALEAL